MNTKSEVNCITILALLLLLFIPISASAQWEEDRSLNSSSTETTSYKNSMCIAAAGDTLHVVWKGIFAEGSEVCYVRSSDGGSNWGSSTRLTYRNNQDLNSLDPPIVVASGPYVHIVWVDARDGNQEIYYKCSRDGGVSWQEDKRLTENIAVSIDPSIAVSGSNVLVTWSDTRNGSNDIYYKCSVDNGNTWSVDKRLSFESRSVHPSVAICGANVQVIWQEQWIDEGEIARSEIHYTHSINSGETWETVNTLSGPHTIYDGSSIAVFNNTVHVIWLDSYGIRYRQSDDGGTTWKPTANLTDNVSGGYQPSLAISDSKVHVAWETAKDVSYTYLFYRRSTDDAVSWERQSIISSMLGSSDGPTVTASGSATHLVWADSRDGKRKIYYKRNPTGNLRSDLDIYNNGGALYGRVREGLHHNIMIFKFESSQHNIIIEVVRSFSLINSSSRHGCNPDPDGPSADPMLSNVHYKFIPCADTGILNRYIPTRIGRVLNLRPAERLVTTKIRGSINVPATLPQGEIEAGTVRLHPPDRDVPAGFYTGLVVVEGSGSDGVEVISDSFLVAVQIGKPSASSQIGAPSASSRKGYQVYPLELVP